MVLVAVNDARDPRKDLTDRLKTRCVKLYAIAVANVVFELLR
jgi:hypothetical protein